MKDNEMKLLEFKPIHKTRLCKHHYGVLIENMVEYRIPIKPVIANGYAGIIHNCEVIEVGYPCLMCARTGVYND